jgi:serine/threonine protein phosphatase PrpC
MSMGKYWTSFLQAFRRRQHRPLACARQEKETNVLQAYVMLPITVWLEQVKNGGEDAAPITMSSRDSSFGGVAVFDGLGGGGAGRFEVGSGVTWTGARLASNVARDSLINTVMRLASRVSDQRESAESKLEISACNTIDNFSDPPVNSTGPAGEDDGSETFFEVPNLSLEQFKAISLSQAFDEDFSRAVKAYGGQMFNSRIQTRLKRLLPTTFAGAFFSQGGGRASIKVFWAGDSRIYFLGRRGLVQLSEDHAQVAQAGVNDLTGDAPLTRVISELPNDIDSCSLPEILEPGFLIACTDGAYAYFSTERHFEIALWEALSKHTATEQHETLYGAIARVTQDDASLAMIPVGFGHQAALVRDRPEEIINECRRFDACASELREATDTARRLEAAIEDMRGRMRARPRGWLEVSGSGSR